MRIDASTAGRKGDLRNNCRRLNLVADSDQDATLLTALYHVLTGSQGEAEFEKQRLKLRNQWLRKAVTPSP